MELISIDRTIPVQRLIKTRIEQLEKLMDSNAILFRLVTTNSFGAQNKYYHLGSYIVALNLKEGIVDISKMGFRKFFTEPKELKEWLNIYNEILREYDISLNEKYKKLHNI